MQRSVVCGVDGSEPGAAALSTASWLAERLGARLVAVHVAPQPATPPGGSYGAYLMAAHAAEQRGMQVLAEAAHEQRSTWDVARRVELGDPAERLVSVASDEDAGLVVVGSRGNGALKSALLGSVSTRLVACCDRPVVIVGSGGEVPGSGRPVRSLVCGVDRSEAVDRAARVAASLAGALDLRLVLAHAYSPVWSEGSIPASSGVRPVDAEKLRELAKRDAIEVLERAEGAVGATVPGRSKLLVGEAAERLADLAVRERAAMIVLGSRGRGPMKAALLGSVSSAVVESAAVPVVVVTDDVATDAAPTRSPATPASDRSG